MLARAKKNCAAFGNIAFEQADITSLGYPDNSFDAVVAGNVIHLLDDPMKALNELDRVCKPGGRLIIPTYMNRDKKGNTSGFAAAVGKAGADFKRQFTVESYRQFFLDAGYRDVTVQLAEGRIPCAVAVMNKRKA
jgi:ubiquinone/menaquinone biosynthesis C-methylase UbiE